jgi:hypothetical protein
MTEDVDFDIRSTQPRAKRHKRLKWFLAAAALLIAVAVVPPMVSLNRYRNRIERLIATSLGRPVQLSSVGMRLLPWPAFELSDLSVAEDPRYGAEPVLHAGAVTASIRFLPLWRGRLEIGTISVDDASLNLVRSEPGRWNLDPLFRTAAVKAGSEENSAQARRAAPLPYLKATNSRINIKDGAEKLPFSLINTDFELWQESPGQWHIRLRGQPARTDVSLFQEDTGVVRLEASVGRAPALRDMPIHLDLDWRQAQLGQLARLVTGSDPGWRGDLTGEVHVDGTANTAEIRARLEATRVHRAEFAPAEPLDFDANCGFVYHYPQRTLEHLACDSPLGDGHIRLTGAMPRADEPLKLEVELEQVPVAAGLDALRTLRSDVPDDLEAGGEVSGKLAYAPAAADDRVQPASTASGERARKEAPDAPPPLTGSLTVNNFELSGAELKRPIQIAKIVLEPEENTLQETAQEAARETARETDRSQTAQAQASQAQALDGQVTLPAGGTAPMTVNFRLDREGYQVTLRGQANFERARELLRAAGVAGPAGLDALAGDPLGLDLHAEGEWLPAPAEGAELALAENGAAPASGALPGSFPDSPLGSLPGALPSALPGTLVDSLSGTVTVHDANWKADFLAHAVEISQATLHLGNGEFRWDPVEFAYGPVKGTASLTVPVSCAGPAPCPPQFTMHLGTVNAATLETAILGVRQKGTLLSDLIAKLDPESAPPWPQLEGQVTADALVLGPVTLKQPEAQLKIRKTGADITHLEAGLLGGKLDGTGSFERAASDDDKPQYALECELAGLNAQAVGRLIGEGWSGGALDAHGAVKLAGYTAEDLAGSATGKVHFQWRHGTVTVKNPGATDPAELVPAALKRFDAWTADAAIADGAIRVGSSEVKAGGRKLPLKGEVEFGDPPQVSFAEGAASGAHGTTRPAAEANGDQTTPAGTDARHTDP